MTSKLTITDERLAQLVAFKPLPGTDINLAARDEWMVMAAELQERRKAAAKTITLPTPACTYADHSYPAYTKQQVLTMLESLGVTVVEEDV